MEQLQTQTSDSAIPSAPISNTGGSTTTGTSTRPPRKRQAGPRRTQHGDSQASSSNNNTAIRGDEVPTGGQQQHQRGGAPNRGQFRQRNNNRPQQAVIDGSLTGPEGSHRPNDQRPPRQNRRGANSSGPRRQKNAHGERDTDPVGSGGRSTPMAEDPKAKTSAPSRPGRAARFGGKLTTGDDNEGHGGDGGKGKESVHKPAVKKPTYQTMNPLGDDLASTLIRSLSTAPYPDCPICFSGIRPEHAVWSCSPSTPLAATKTKDEGATTGDDAAISASAQSQIQYCWTPFHVGCIKSWAMKSVKDVADAWRARGEPKDGDWRCPGCQVKRYAVPLGYRCFCGSVTEPKLGRLATPHSCGGPCSRVRETGCGHPCPLLCHPGPCPPCQITSQLKCHCPRKTMLTFRCGVITATNVSSGTQAHRDYLSCGNVCGRMLSCGKHACSKTCHSGECDKCEVLDDVQCYCGRERTNMLCGEGKAVECFVQGAKEPWIGRYSCEATCERLFDCGIHKCEKPCHPPSITPAICPRSPAKVTYCPCGRKTIAPQPSATEAASNQHYDFPPRLNCEAPIPTCTSPCSKPHPNCQHLCREICHTGPCPPCTVPITRPCRCGSTTRSLPCYQAYQANQKPLSASNNPAGEDALQQIQEREFLCERPCLALRACGKHECRRLCCPLASLASITGNRKSKKKATAGMNEAAATIGTERGGLHECDLVCGKLLSCGTHACEERDHKGPCPPCLRSSFEEMFCNCGRTMLEPPIPCGMKVQCRYPCPRPPPPCGHTRTIHPCHDDSVPCPPCVHLTSKQCACGKKTVPHVKCALETEKVSCGTVCGKLMPCGFHHCESLCHPGDCGTCTAPCGKLRKLCLPDHHPCTLPCHAPSSCPETEPCESIASISCPCGRLRQAVHCGKRTAHPAGHQPPPIGCTPECAKAKRNAKLAEALGISTQGDGSKDKNVSYNDEVVAFARANAKFLPIVEKAFAEFVASEKKHQVLPHMTPEKRKFVHDLALVYRLDTHMIDQEPNRSVQLIRRIDTRIPTPTLSAHLNTLAPAPNLGKLADLRSLKTSPAPSPVPAGLPVPGASMNSWRSGVGLPGRSASPSYVNVNQKVAGVGSITPGRGWTSVVASMTPPPPAATTTSATSSPSAGAGTGTGALPPVVAMPRTTAAPPRHPPSASPAPPPPPTIVEPVVENWEDDL
ncbi:hypothetical protein FA15DRAFT_673293 [Coprinopsis marcescibilis]|uniref:R3H domain-containing protein n=1 Tax=Coprinopsis marcescibilis TaxID=230819 RepID=A0A5C3KKA2_COPMA|nr:hypothetical protein FA15DRAFT_673293 [Coprinopsis marcescibilis]